MEAESSCRNN